MATLLGAQSSTFDLETVVPAAAGVASPKGHMYGLQVAYGSATTITIAAGECRDSTDTYDLTLAALVTVSIATAGAALGLDETTLTATATTSNGSASVTMSASLWVETPMTNTVKTLTGTITSVGTALTGSSTKFLSEIAVGDVVRSSANGASRVTAITSDTAATLVAAFPGGDVSGVAATAYENLTFWCNTSVAGDKFAINTVSHAGTAIVMSSTASGGGSEGAGKTAKVGVEIASRVYHAWLAYGGSGTTGILSTQRTRPYGVSGYTTAWRRLGGLCNNSSGNFIYHHSENYGSMRFVEYDDPGNTARVLSAGTSTTGANFDTIPFAPSTARFVQLRMIVVYSSTARSLSIYENSGAGPMFTVDGIASATVNAYGPMVNKGCAIKYALSGAGSDAYVDMQGYWEAL